jgi:Ni/Fe-hydrogenase subunit HybB-like protein
MTALQDYQKINSGGGPIYIPAWTEVTVSIGLTFIACLTYLFIVENFNILDKSEMEAANKSQKLTEDSKPGSHTLGA